MILVTTKAAVLATTTSRAFGAWLLPTVATRIGGVAAAKRNQATAEAGLFTATDFRGSMKRVTGSSGRPQSVGEIRYSEPTTG